MKTLLASLSDEEIVQQAQTGDTDSFSELVKRYQGTVYGLAYHFVRNFADAEDLSQEVFITAYYRLCQVKHPSRFAAWLRIITINHCRMWLRKQREMIPLTEIRNLSVPSPQELIEQYEQEIAVRQAIDSLPESQRLIVTMYYLGNSSYREIGTFLGLSETAIQGRLQRARQQLKGRLMQMVKETLGEKQLPEDFSHRIQEVVANARKYFQAIDQAEAQRLSEDPNGVFEMLLDIYTVGLDPQEEASPTKIHIEPTEKNLHIDYFFKDEEYRIAELPKELYSNLVKNVWFDAWVQKNQRGLVRLVGNLWAQRAGQKTSLWEGALDWDFWLSEYWTQYGKAIQIEIGERGCTLRVLKEIKPILSKNTDLPVVLADSSGYNMLKALELLDKNKLIIIGTDSKEFVPEAVAKLNGRGKLIYSNELPEWPENRKPYWKLQNAQLIAREITAIATKAECLKQGNHAITAAGYPSGLDTALEVIAHSDPECVDIIKVITYPQPKLENIHRSKLTMTYIKDAMKEKAKEFSAYEVDYTRNLTSNLILLPEPIYVYTDEERNIELGGIFAFSLGNNPEVLLTFESVRGVTSFNCEIVRLGGEEMHVKWKNREFWRSEKGDGQPRSRRPSSYISFHYSRLEEGAI